MSTIVDAHRASGSFFEADGTRSFRLDEGEGDPVLLMHGAPASSFLYRKVTPALARRGLRGIAIDLPGFGLADRPEDFDYSWTGLGRFVAASVQALGLQRFHLVVHDLGGPVGFEMAARVPERIASLTILNTVIEVDDFERPWPMAPLALPVVDRMWITQMKFRPVFRMLMRAHGIEDGSKISSEELNAYLDLMFGDDNARAFLKIMKSFELTADKSTLYRGIVSSDRYPTQVVWGDKDPALPYARYGRVAERLTSTTATKVPARHFLQEDQYDALADAIARIASVET
ncbi:MAG: alpha/beta fold hydrolase [Deltaproteobacteria bacterium]|nr:alpha/beta fold hydrolase [Deltaproteobacteria bacterium]